MSEETVDGTNGCSKVRTGTQNEAALLALMEKTGYNMVQENGQRKFGGPPPGVDFFYVQKIGCLMQSFTLDKYLHKYPRQIALSLKPL